ncbi:hypothetical protein HXX76_008165 [Chlamydomonas incerta]|uniref:NADP-dependent oxidoreductase domain-containing protein n=1 Tax=Chlamydomonas incerta TaxID=51695 RepID=A0A835SUY0_CHLIN|nr:hypothetical protein HXX76_008165 [Chlamydomonas incerta]|eukprot:KAG2433807.1 hypothetical protein HXX76_008165 [Chlamydomonas incerta]
MLAETWIPAPPEDAGEEAGPPPPSFDAAAPEYNELARRLAKTAPFQKWNELTIQAKELEQEIAGLKGPDAEAKQAELENVKVQIADAEAAMAEMKQSFYDDPLSLTGWMQALTDLADGGMTTFEVSGQGWPYCSLRQLFGEVPSSAPPAGFFDGVERVLGTFKRRYEKERGPGRIQLLLKLAPNLFSDAWATGGAAAAVAAVEAYVERARANVFGPDGGVTAEGVPEPLDLVQLAWWDFEAADPLPVLKALQKMATDQLQVDEDSGEVSVSEPRKIRGIGLVDFPADRLKAAIQAGVPITCVQVEYSYFVRTAQPVVDLCAKYGIKVLARGGTLGGLLSAKYSSAPPPDPVRGDADLDSVPGCLDAVNNLGGWDVVQLAHQMLKTVADRHGVKPETVMLRWQIDAGCFPLVTSRWSNRVWRQFGYEGWSSFEVSGGRPGVDAALFQVESFLDELDYNVLGNAKGVVKR